MMAVERRLSWSPRLGQLLLAALGVAVVHRVVGLLATEPLRAVVHGYDDRALLAPGGDAALELVLARQSGLLAALGSAGLLLLAGRALCFLAAFLVWKAAFGLATAGPSATSPRLHLVWALASTAVLTSSSAALLGGLGWMGVRLGRVLARTPDGPSPWLLAVLVFALGLLTMLGLVWLELVRLGLAGGRWRPLAAARAASRAFRENWVWLCAARLVVTAAVTTVLVAAIQLLPVVTQESSTARAWATVSIDLGLLGAIYLRSAWLTWASAHLRADLGPAPIPATFEGAAPDGAPDVPADPNPSPDASPV